MLVFALVKAQDYGWGSARTLGLGAVAVALLAAFVFIESRSKAPLHPPGHLPLARHIGRQPVMLSLIGGMYAFFFLVSLYVQQVLGYSPLEAGLAFLPVHARHHRRRRRVAALSRAIPVHLIALMGIALAVLGLVILRWRRRGRDVPRNLLPGIIPMSIGMGMTFLPLTPVATTRLRRATPASRRACSTRRSRSAARSAWRSCRRSPPRTRRACSRASAERRAQRARAEAVVEVQVAYLGGIGLLVLGAIVLVAVLRTRDMAAVAAAEGQPVAVGA